MDVFLAHASRGNKKYCISACSSSQKNSEALGNIGSFTTMAYLAPSNHLDRNKNELSAFLNQLSLSLDLRVLPEETPRD